jgi:hypothetical protein
MVVASGTYHGHGYNACPGHPEGMHDEGAYARRPSYSVVHVTKNVDENRPSLLEEFWQVMDAVAEEILR